MGFRSAPGHILRWENTDLPAFSNFAFCEAHYGAHSVLRRILSLARKLRYRSMLVEEIREPECALLAEENAALRLRCPDFDQSIVHRLSFYSSLPNTAPQPHEFLGYAVFKVDRYQDGTVRPHIYESVLRPTRDSEQNNFIHTQRSFDLSTAAGTARFPGVLYAQQNDRTFVCAHVALRTVLSSILPAGDVAYSELNAVAGVDHVNVRVGKGHGGLGPPQIEAILNHYAVPFRRLTHEPQLTPAPPRVEYHAELYAAIESGCPALLGFELAHDPATAAPPGRHIIPVLGHTFNDDAWMPDAERSYFGSNKGFFRSEAWLSAYVVHDDNVGPYFCLPRHYLSHDFFRILYALQPHPASLSPSEAEAYACDWLTALPQIVPGIGVAWYGRFAVYAQLNALVLRPILIERRAYLDHLASLQDRHGQRFPVGELAPIEALLPPHFWMIEISAPELFPLSRQKFGEVILPPDRPAGGAPALPLVTRLPGLLLREFTPVRVQPEGYTPIYSHPPA